MRRILVTRPEPAASSTARRLKSLGFSPVVLPLTEIRGIAVDMAKIPDRPGAVAATSANAVRNAPPELVRALAGTTCFAVGETTASLARAAGFSTVVQGPGDAEGLARALLTSEAASPVAYLCGRVRRPAFEERLATAGLAVAAIETYDTVRIAHGTPRVFSVLGAEALDGALIYSVETARAFLDLADRPEFAAVLGGATLFCLSPRMAEVLSGGLRGKILFAAEPTEAALLSLLGKSP